MKKLALTAAFLVVMGFFGYRSCASHRIDERVFYQGRGLELKVVTAFENLPLHFTGNVYRVQCRSTKTANFAPTKFSDPGWQSYVPLYNGFQALGYRSDSKHDIERLVEVARVGYHITDELTLMVESGTGVAVSFGGCASFAVWNYDLVDESLLIETSPEFEKCQANLQESQQWPHIQQLIKRHGSIARACQYSKFEGVNKPHFGNFSASQTGAARFEISSSAFLAHPNYSVSTADFGKNWVLAPLDSAKDSGQDQ